MKQVRQIYKVYILLLLVFFWRTAVFWFNNRYHGVQQSGLLLYIALVGIELLSVILILTSPKFKKKDKGIHIICAIWEIMMLVVLVYNHAAIGNYAKCLAWPLFFESTYLFIRADRRLLSGFRRIYYVFLAFGLVALFSAMILIGFGGQTNMVYFVSLTAPVILITNNKRQRNIILIVMTFIAVLSMKRSMMLAIVLFWVAIGAKYLLGGAKKGVAFLVSILVLAAAYGSFKIVDSVSGGYLGSRFDNEGDISNGRELIYTVTLEMIMKSSNADKILGHGHNAVDRDSLLEISAHNEFLEITYDYGILILIVYLGLWVYVVKEWWYHYHNETEFFIPYTMSICIFAVMAMVSQLVLYVSYFLYLVMFWAMVAALKDGKMAETAHLQSLNHSKTRQ
ncbi:MAG: O-antigen ligase family protein [Bacteroidales bacterium]|nr:O-antigen ligase family protein [Bacteroidales bacterium]